MTAKPPLKADAIAIPNNQHPQHQLRINRGPADVAVERGQLIAQVSQHPRHDRIDTAQQMARRDALLKVE